MLKLKASCSTEIKQVVSAEESLLAAVDNCFDVYHDMVSAGVESREIEDVMSNLILIRDNIKNYGIKSYYYTFDKDNEFAAKYHVPAYEPGMGLEYCATLGAQYIEAAEEGLHEWWARFYEALKNLVSKFIAWCSTTFTLRNRYIEKLKESKDKFKYFNEDKEVECMNCNDFDNILEVVYAIHDDLPKIKTAKDSATLTSLMKTAMFFNKKHLLQHIGYDSETDTENCTISISENAEGLSDKCPITKETLKKKQWTMSAITRAADDLLRIESKDNFKKTCGDVKDAMAKIIDDGIDEMKKKRKDASDETKDMIDKEVINAIHVRGAFIRVVNKEMILENRLMVRLLRTMLSIAESCEEPKK